MGVNDAWSQKAHWREGAGFLLLSGPCGHSCMSCHVMLCHVFAPSPVWQYMAVLLPILPGPPHERIVSTTSVT